MPYGEGCMTITRFGNALKIVALLQVSHFPSYIVNPQCPNSRLVGK